MKRPRISLVDVHIYGGTALFGVGLELIHRGLGLALVGVTLLALGLWSAR